MNETAPHIALVFPGQGSQSIGMLAELSELHPLVKASFEEASDGAGVDLWALSQAGPEEMLNRTQEEIERMLRERLKEQRREHNGGKYWVGTHGISPFGNDGYNGYAISY